MLGTWWGGKRGKGYLLCGGSFPLLPQSSSVEAPHFTPFSLFQMRLTSSQRGRRHNLDPNQQKPHTPQAWLRVGGSALRTNGRPEASGVTSQQGQVILSSWTRHWEDQALEWLPHRGTTENLSPGKTTPWKPELKTTVRHKAQKTSFEPRVQLDLNMAFLPWTSQFCELGCLPLAIEMLRPPQLVCPPC